MSKAHDETVSTLVASVLEERAKQAIDTLDLDALPVSGPGDAVDRLTLSKALAIVLFQHLVDHVPSASAYVDERRADGGRVLFDHGAIRTVRFPSSATGGLPSGEKAITRILRPLGYVLAGTYPLPVLKMTGRAYLHADAPEHMPQFFVSELHIERFDGDFATVAARVFGQSADPLGETSLARLSFLAETGVLALADAKGLLSEIVTAFGRHHPIPCLSDYRALLERSSEAAWIATEGNAFNHATDRVRDLDALVALERFAGAADQGCRRGVGQWSYPSNGASGSARHSDIPVRRRRLCRPDRSGLVLRIHQPELRSGDGPARSWLRQRECDRHLRDDEGGVT